MLCMWQISRKRKQLFKLVSSLFLTIPEFLRLIEEECLEENESSFSCRLCLYSHDILMTETDDQWKSLLQKSTFWIGSYISVQMEITLLLETFLCQFLDKAAFVLQDYPFHTCLSWNFSGCWGETYHRIWKMMQEEAEQGGGTTGKMGECSVCVLLGCWRQSCVCAQSEKYILSNCSHWGSKKSEPSRSSQQKSQSDRKRGDRRWGGGNHTDFVFEEGRLRNSLVIPGKFSKNYTF